MEVEKEDRFASIIKFCKPTASQEAKLQSCPLARESENFSGSNPDPLPSSPDPTPSEPIGIVIVSAPESSGASVARNSPSEDEPVFHTPPEEQNPEESSSDGARSVDLEDTFGKQKRLRTSWGEKDDEFISKKVRLWEGLNGATVPIDDSDMITTEMDEIQGLDDYPETVNLVITESADNMSSAKLGEDSLEKIVDDVFRGLKEVEQRKLEETEGAVELDASDENDELMKTCEYAETVEINKDEMVGLKEVEQRKLEETEGAVELDASDENDELMKTCEYAENVEVNKDEMVGRNGTCCGSLGFRKVQGDGCVEMRDGGVGGDEEFADINKNEDAGLRIPSKNVEDVGGSGNDRGRNRRGGSGGGGGVGRKRQLPKSMKRTEKDVGRDALMNAAETRTGLLKDFLNAFNLVVGDAENGCEDTDILEIARRRGMTFPRPRWWPSETDDV